MKRKKFVKQLMAMGYQRNTANGLAMYARMGHWTYEQYLQIEKRSTARDRALLDIQVALVDCFIPAVKATLRDVEQLREAIASIKWDLPDLRTLWVTEQVKEDPLPPWPKENPHRIDALDALTYAAQAERSVFRETS